MKNYKVKLTTLAPVHIGSGNKITKNEYLYNSMEQYVSFIDGAKLTKYLKQKQLLQKYITFLSNERSPILMTFLKQNNIQTNEWHQFISYTERVNQGKTDGRYGKQSINKKMNDIHTFIRDGRGVVYIPGSSLKGAFRTVLLKSFSEDTKDNELFKKIKISDSLPCTNEELAIYQKIDVNKRDNPMPLYRECIIPKTTIEFDMVIEDEVITINEIKNAFKRFNQNYVEKWLSGIAKTDGGSEFFQKETIFKAIQSDDDCYLYLGGGSGFVSKSLHYQAYSKDEAKKMIFEQLRKSFRNTYGKFREVPENLPIALKATVDLKKKEWYQQGLCKIEFIEK
ncbi:type III-A CRISPR-associated RAMP protein Csm5 [Macrococcus capreoli]